MGDGDDGGDDPGDIGGLDGSLGGNTADASGETSATLGGETTAAQADNNTEAGILGGSVGLGDLSADPSLLSKLSQLLANKPFQALLSITNPALAPIISVANMAMNQGRGSGGAFGGNMGGALGGTIAGPVGGAIGSAIGGSVGADAVGGIPGMSASDVSAANAANSDPGNAAGGLMNFGQPQQQSTPLDPWMGGMAGLASLFSDYHNNRDSKSLQNSLGNLFGPNSPYAQQLYGQLRAKDAASGRRSDYAGLGARLQAGLAEPTARMAPTMAALQQQRQAQHQQTLGNIFNIMRQMGGPKKIYDMAKGGLSGLFGNQGGQQGGFMGPPESLAGDGQQWGDYDMGMSPGVPEGGVDLSGGGDWGGFSNGSDFNLNF